MRDGTWGTEAEVAILLSFAGVHARKLSVTPRRGGFLHRKIDKAPVAPETIFPMKIICFHPGHLGVTHKFVLQQGGRCALALPEPRERCHAR